MREVLPEARPQREGYLVNQNDVLFLDRANGSNAEIRGPPAIHLVPEHSPETRRVFFRWLGMWLRHFGMNVIIEADAKKSIWERFSNRSLSHVRKNRGHARSRSKV